MDLSLVLAIVFLIPVLTIILMITPIPDKIGELLMKSRFFFVAFTFLYCVFLLVLFNM
jgi:hypothetical protein